MNQTLKNIFAISFLLLVAGLGYFLFIQRDASGLLLSEDPVVASQLLVQASTFIEKRRRVEAVAVDTSILTNDKFTRLVIYTDPVPVQPLSKEFIFEPAVPIPLQ